MYLTAEEERMLNGDDGATVQKAMEILVTLGDVFEADRMVETSSVHVSGISYNNIRDPGLDLLEEWAGGGTRTRACTTINPSGMDCERWREFGVDDRFAAKQQRIVAAFERMGVEASLTCTPYLIGNRPRRGDHVAWAESSAVAYANSVLGARTNREGGPSALASALTGRTPRFGYHLDDARRATHEIRVQCHLEGVYDYSALGYLVGDRIGQSVPRFTALPRPSLEELKALCAGLAASGAVALFHLDDVTGEGNRGARLETIAVARRDLTETTEQLSTGEAYDHICIGCPHCSLRELATIARRVTGKTFRRTLWVFTSRQVADAAKERGYYAAIEAAGGKVISDTCMVVAPMRDMGVGGLVTNSCKAAHYAPTTCRVPVTLNSLDECLQAALGE